MKKLTTMCVMFAALGAAQIPESQKSSGLLNGRFWEAIRADNRSLFLVGYVESLKFAQGAMSYQEPAGVHFPASSTFGETVRGLDRIYDAPENAGIPIVFALGVFDWRVTGTDETVITESLRSLRQQYSERSAPLQTDSAPSATTPATNVRPIPPRSIPPAPVVHVPPPAVAK